MPRMPTGVPRRHSRRAESLPMSLPVSLAARLQQTAAAEGAVLRFVNHPGPMASILRLTHHSEWQARGDVDRRAETLAWSDEPAGTRRDGVHATSFPSHPWASGTAALAQRDFDQGRAIGRAGDPPTGASQLAVLTTVGDLPSDWLRDFPTGGQHAARAEARPPWVTHAAGRCMPRPGCGVACRACPAGA